MDALWDSLRENWISLMQFLPRLVAAVLLVLLVVGAAKAIGRTLGRLARRLPSAHHYALALERAAFWALSLLGFVVALDFLGLSTAALSFLAAGGVLAIVFGFAFQQVGENLLAGLFFSINPPFKMGDLIQIGEDAGLIQSLDLRSIHLRAEDGRDIFVPNSEAYRSHLTNFTRDGLRRLDFVIGLDYGDHLQEASELLTEVMAKNPTVLLEPSPQVYLEQFGAQYVELLAVFWIDLLQPDMDHRAIRTEVMHACRTALKEGGYTFSADTTSSIRLSGSLGSDE